MNFKKIDFCDYQEKQNFLEIIEGYLLQAKEINNRFYSDNTEIYAKLGDLYYEKSEIDEKNRINLETKAKEYWLEVVDTNIG